MTDFLKFGLNTDIAVQIERSPRKTLSVQVRDGQLIVKAPRRTTDAQIRDFLSKHRRWIENHLEKDRQQRERSRGEGLLTDEDLRLLAQRAKEVFPERVKHYAALMGVTYGRITIRCQKTRWGSCSAKGNLNFNCLLMLTPPEVIDSVVVHELAHRKEMNHSERFYEEVLWVYPDYHRWHKWLKENGGVLQRRLG